MPLVFQEPKPVDLAEVITRKGVYVSTRSKSATDVLYSVRSIIEEPACAQLSQFSENEFFLLYIFVAFSDCGQGELVEMQVEIYRMSKEAYETYPLYVLRAMPLTSTAEVPPHEYSPGFNKIIKRLKASLRLYP
jgi:hypothetical protein